MREQVLLQASQRAKRLAAHLAKEGAEQFSKTLLAASGIEHGTALRSC
jgi:hypothetical protein